MSLHVTLPDKYSDIIVNSVVGAAGLSAAGAAVPGIDTIGVTALWGAMLHDMSVRSGHQIDEAFAGKFLLSLGTGLAAHYGVHNILHVILNATGVGIIAAAGISATLHGLLTLRLGIFLADQFENPEFTGNNLVQFTAQILPLLTAIPALTELQDVASIILHPA